MSKCKITVLRKRFNSAIARYAFAFRFVLCASALTSAAACAQTREATATATPPASSTSTSSAAAPTGTPTPTPAPTAAPRRGSARIVHPEHPTADIVVADYDLVSDYGADATGARDASAAIQQALDDCYTGGGGTVWVPAGTYRVTRSILVKPFCTLRGDWQDPDADLGAGSQYGTVIRAELLAGDRPLFLVGGSAGLMGVTVYYPDQNASNPVPYGWAIEIRGNGDSLGTAGGNHNYHASSVVNVTLLNAYKGIGVNAPPYEKSVHELSRVENVKGTALYQGLDARNCADVGTWRGITFNNRYWADAPAAYNPPPRGALDAWTRANGTAFTLADVEWDSFYDISAEGYNVGIRFVPGARISFAGQFAWAQITDCDVAVHADANSIDARSPNWGASFLRSVLEGSVAAVRNNAVGHIHIADSTLTGGIRGWSARRVSVTSPGTSPAAYTEIGAPPRPARAVLYDVSQAPYNAPATLGAAPTGDADAGDASAAIQRALDDAGRDGGGIVYLPAGWYRIKTHLAVPANVELRGSSSVLNRSQGTLSNGTVLWAYQEGTGSPALITLQGRTSGVRGLRVFYPGNGFAVPESWKIYPPAIRVSGVQDAYVVNVAIENGYQGVVVEAGSDRHYLKNVVGATTHGLIRVGASAEGWIEDCHSNLNFWPRNAYGITPWIEEGSREVFWGSLLATRKANAPLIRVENAANEHMLNNFVYGGQHGVYLDRAAAEIVNIGSDNVGGYTVISEPGGAPVRVMNSMRYNGQGNTSGVTATYNELNLD